MKKYKFTILANEDPEGHNLWIEACKKHSETVDYRVIELTSSHWLEDLQKDPFDYLLAKPSGLTMPWKQLYDERLMILGNTLNYAIYPSLEEVLIYENKRYFSYWLKANKIPHPKTFIFYNKKEAEKFANQIQFPIVAKLNIGASGNGVQILKNKQDIFNYIKQIFSIGKTSHVGPRLDKGHIAKRIFNKILHPKSLIKRINIYKSIAGDVQKGFCLFQEFIKHEYEWRVVRIGDSFFAHKKLLKEEKASGSLEKSYDNPPLALLTFVKKITDYFNFNSVAIDVFTDSENTYLINEIQCIFGQSDEYQMMVNGIPGRYQFKNNKWIFEKGIFNSNQCYDLRVKHLINLLDSKD